MLPNVLIHRLELRLIPCRRRRCVPPLPVKFLPREPPISRLATWSWNPPTALSVRGANTQVSDLKSNTACTTALKKKPENRGSAPSLLMILIIIFHTALTRDKLLNTTGQLSSTNRRYHPSHVSEGGHHLQGAPIGAEFPGVDLPLLLHCQAPSLPLHPPFALCCAPVHPIQRPPCHQHVTQRAPWVGEVALLQYHHGVSDMPVLEVHHHRCLHQHLSTTPFDWAGPRSRLHGKRHPVSPGQVAPVFLIALLPQPPF